MRRRPLHTVVETREFQRRVRRLLTDDDLATLIDHIAANPDAGDVMVGSGGARKLRWPAKSKGKSRGVRVITFYGGPPVPVFLLSVFGKGQKVNLTGAERRELRKLLGRLVTEYQKGVSDDVEGGREHPPRCSGSVGLRAGRTRRVRRPRAEARRR